MDETSQKIIDATMTLIRDKGYVATTTKDIAKLGRCERMYPLPEIRQQRISP